MPPPLPRIKSAEQLSPEELQRALPSTMFAASSLVWSTLLASGVAAAGLVTIVYLATWIAGAAGGLRIPSDAPAAPPAKPKSLAELIAERRAELEAELDELRALPRTPEVRARVAEVEAELRPFQPRPWWRVW